MLNKFKINFLQLVANRDGAVAIMMAILVLPMFFLALGAIDVLRMTNTSLKLQSATDAATLAAASLTNDMDIETTITEYIDANTPDTGFWESLNVEVSIDQNVLNAKRISVSASVVMDTPLLAVGGMKNTLITANSTAAESSQNIEISMVLDISSSMRGSKLTNLKTASKDFVEIMLADDDATFTSISLIPFGGTVNIGDLYDDYVALTSDPNTIVNPTEAEYNIGTSVVDRKFRFEADEDDEDAVPQPSGCIEYRSDDFDLDDIPANSRAQVPAVWKWNENNPWCPPDSTKTLFNTNNENALKTAIDAMVLSDGTGMDIGALWGAKALSGEFKGKLGGDFPDRPADFDDDTASTMKIAIIMTDGEITAQFRPRDFTTGSTHLPQEPGGYELKNNLNQQTIASKGNYNNSPGSSDRAIPYFKRICEDLNDNDVLVYTIGFQINKNSTADKLLQYCATTSSMYYFVETLDINAAFESIAASINALRITG